MLALMRRQELDGFIDGLLGTRQQSTFQKNPPEGLDALSEMRALMAAVLDLANDETKPATSAALQATLKNMREMTRISAASMRVSSRRASVPVGNCWLRCPPRSQRCINSRHSKSCRVFRNVTIDYALSRSWQAGAAHKCASPEPGGHGGGNCDPAISWGRFAFPTTASSFSVGYRSLLFFVACRYHPLKSNWSAQDAPRADDPLKGSCMCLDVWDRVGARLDGPMRG